MLDAFPAWTPSATFSPLVPRISNPYGWYVHVVNGKQTLEQPTPVNIFAG